MVEPLDTAAIRAWYAGKGSDTFWVDRLCDALDAEVAAHRSTAAALAAAEDERDTAVSGGYVDALRHWKAKAQAAEARRDEWQRESERLLDRLAAVEALCDEHMDGDGGTWRMNPCDVLAALRGEGDQPVHEFDPGSRADWHMPRCNVCREFSDHPIHSGEGRADG